MGRLLVGSTLNPHLGSLASREPLLLCLTRLYLSCLKGGKIPLPEGIPLQGQTNSPFASLFLTYILLLWHQITACSMGLITKTPKEL